MMIKFIIFILLALVGTAIVVTRFLSSMISGQSQAFLINKLKKNPEKASEYINQLDMLMDKRSNISREAFELIRTKIQSTAMIENYRILYALPLNDQLLFFTEVTYTDFDVNALGGSDDIKKCAQHNFLLRYQPEQRELELYSTLYADINEKNHKQGFITALLKTTT